MSMKINYNVSAMISNNALKLNDNKLTKSLERLSSGYKINSARDNAAGLAISRRMNAQIKGLSAAAQDAKDGVSVVEIADGALAEIHDILQRMNELAVKSATGSISDDDREFIQEEVAALGEEIDRIGNTTEYNSQKIFAGDFDLKGYTDNVNIKVDYYSEANMYGKYKFSLESVEYDEEGKVTTVNGDGARILQVTRPDGATEEYRVNGDIYHLTFTGDNGDEFKLDMAGIVKDVNQFTPPFDPKNPAAGYTYTADAKDIVMDLTGYGPMTLQIGANENQTLDITIRKISMETLGFKYQDSDETKDMILDMRTQKGGDKAIDQVKAALESISQLRSKLGAYQNRLEHTQNSLSVSEENVTAAYSRIMDTDMAEEMSLYSNLQIVSQAATSVLAQANQRPSQMLQLLQ